MGLFSQVKAIASQTGRDAGESLYSQGSAAVLQAAGVSSKVPGEDANSAGSAPNGATSGVGPSPRSEAAVVGGAGFSVSGIIAAAKASPVKAGAIGLAVLGGLWLAFKAFKKKK